MIVYSKTTKLPKLIG